MPRHHATSTESSSMREVYGRAGLRLRLRPQFSSVQSLSRVWLFATPWTTARQASLSITNSRSPPKRLSITWLMGEILSMKTTSACSLDPATHLWEFIPATRVTVQRGPVKQKMTRLCTSALGAPEEWSRAVSRCGRYPCYVVGWKTQDAERLWEYVPFCVRKEES